MDTTEIAILQNEIKEKLHSWLVSVLYWFAWYRGKNAYPEYSKKETESNNGTVYLWGWEPGSWNIEYEWYFYYGHLYLRIRDKQEHIISKITIAGKSLDTLLVINGKYLKKLRADDLEVLTRELDKLIRSFFINIHQVNAVQICSSPVHSHNKFDSENSFQSLSYATTCQFINGQWFCEKCLTQFNLIKQNHDQNFRLKSHQNEFDRLTPGLKLSVLQRDNFTCQQCGKGVVDVPEIKLDVKHIISIEKNGKSKHNNLITICSKCKTLFN